MPLLTVENLHISFGGGPDVQQAVKQLSFTLASGELLAIVGESGSGKSVTALSLLQLLPPGALVTGKALFSPEGEPATDLTAADAGTIRSIRGNRISMIFQEPMTSLNPVRTCGNQLREAIQTHQRINRKQAREEALRLLQLVRMPDPAAMLRRYPHQLSGGQQQRLMIAMAMSCRPSLLIADEPTTALDVTVQRAVLDLIRDLQQQQGMGVLFITHDLGLVADVADRVLVLRSGEAVEYGTVKEVLQHPAHPYTRALLRCRPAAQPRGIPLPVDDPEEKAQRIQVQSPAPAVQQVLQKHTILEVNNLVVEFPRRRGMFRPRPAPFRAVDHISFTVNGGEILGLVGESGCGKSTLAKTILQLIRPRSGEVLLNGRNLHAPFSGSQRVKRRELQIVFQDPFGSLNPKMTIGEAIAEPMLVHGICSSHRDRHQQVVELLESVELKADHYHRYPHQFSGGQRQRICIARALAADPSFLVFDESVSALDVRIQAQVLNLLLELRSRIGFSAIFISHDLGVVRYVCERMLVMQAGKIVESGDSDTLFNHPRHPYTRELIRAIPGKQLLPVPPGW